MTDQPPPPPTPNRTGETLWNFLTGLLVVGIIAALVIVALIYLNPRSALNPFPPPTHIPTLAAPTLLPLATQAPTFTPAVVLPTKAPTATLPDQPTPTAILATPAGTLTGPTLTPTVKGSSSFAFIPYPEPIAIDASLRSPSRGCQWMGVGGQAFDLRGNPIPLGIEVQLAGYLDGKPIAITSLTGTATLLYGPSGYELTLADKPIASKGSLWIRLIDQAGMALSDRIYFDTYADCNKNLIIINFTQVK